MKINLPEDILKKVLKPARYTGGEFNAIIKDHSTVDCKFALALPDVYEVGMSNLGLAILYNILNKRNDTACERVYAPWIDMEDEMRQRKIPLFALESKEEIKNFDLLGFSLQYEMVFSNVLNMIDLAGISINASDRTDDEPFIVGGGPCCYNVEPIANFFDFFIIGEGEEILNEVVDEFIKWKKSDRPGGRNNFLERLLKINGVYVPKFYKPIYSNAECRMQNAEFIGMKRLNANAKEIIFKRVVKDMNKVSSIERPIVPYLDIVHNRIMLELFRGCSRGCRFCQAGICYRPARERTEENLRSMARNLIDATGYDEISLTSLSSADYSCLQHLVDDLVNDFRDEKVSFSLPSLRIDSFSIDLAHKLQQVRKSGLTFAPEAGTQRLRDVINKGVNEENLMTACAAAFEKGWKSVKLYFMMGLPTETDEDIIGIAELAKKVVNLYKQIKNRRDVKVTISVSCFVPKPFTPFQWFGQISIEEFERRQQLLKDHITDRAITFNYHNAKLSILEGVIARGDRRLNEVIYTAWKNGAKFDGWSDLFKFDVWQKAFEICNVDMKYYNERERDFYEPLAWDHTSPGVRKNFLIDEWNKALNGELTPDCRRTHCTGCGICQNLGVNVIDYAESQNKIQPQQKNNYQLPITNYQLTKYRAQIRKGKEISVLSHLDYIDLYSRAFKRSKLPIAYSEGFNPHIKISFATALAVGVTSDAEYMDFSLKEDLSTAEVLKRLNDHLPHGAEVIRIKKIRGKVPALMAAADLTTYKIILPFNGTFDEANESIKKFNSSQEINFTRITPKKRQEIEVKKFIAKPIEFEIKEKFLILNLAIKITLTGSIKPSEIVHILHENFDLNVNENLAKIHRTSLTGGGKNLLDI